MRLPWFAFKDPGGTDGSGKEDKKDEDLSLQAAIDKAAADLDKEDDKEDKKDDGDKKDKEDTSDKEGDEDDEDNKDDDDGEADKDEAEKALQLFRLINDPKTSKETLLLLNKQLGITAETTKEEKKVIVKSLKEQFKEALGEDLEWAGDKLFAAVEKIAESIAEEKTKDLRASVAETQKEKQIEVLATAYDSVMGEFENSETLEEDINKLSKIIKIQIDQDPKQYFKTLLYTAAGEKDISLVRIKPLGKKEKTPAKQDNKVQIDLDKLNKARKDAKSRIVSDGDSDKKDKTSNEAPVKSINDAIAQAIASIEAKQDK